MAIEIFIRTVASASQNTGPEPPAATGTSTTTTATIATTTGIRMLRTYTRTIAGSDMTVAAGTSTTAWNAPGNTAASTAALAVDMTSGWQEGIGCVFVFTTSTSTCLPTTTV